MVPVLSRSREFSLFLDGTGTGTGKNWSRKKVPVPVPENLVPEKSTGTGTRKNWSRKKYGYKKNLVLEKSTGTGTRKIWSRKKYRSWYRHTLLFTVQSRLTDPHFSNLYYKRSGKDIVSRQGSGGDGGCKGKGKGVCG